MKCPAPYGPVSCANAGPSVSSTTGVPTAVATCIVPVSFVTSRRHLSSSAPNSTSDVFPMASIAPRDEHEKNRWASGRSDSVPTSTKSASPSPSPSTIAANRSGRHCLFAALAPSWSATSGRSSARCARNHVSMAARACGVTSISSPCPSHAPPADHVKRSTRLNALSDRERAVAQK